MTREHATQRTVCPACQNAIEIAQSWTAGGVNDYGGWILKCAACGEVFDHRLGRDIADSRVTSGASILETYDEALADDRNEARQRHGLAKL